MADWPTTLHFPAGGLINNASPASMLMDYMTIHKAHFAAGGTWPAANRAFYYPFIIDTTVTAYQMAFEVVTQSGNYDAGIYDANGVRLVSVGSTAVPAAGLATPNIADTTLTPGLYYMALSVDNTTASVARTAPLSNAIIEVTGARSQNLGSVVLPDPAVFSTSTLTYVPGLAVAFRSVI